LRNSGKCGPRSQLIHLGSDSYGILSLWLIFEVHKALSVKRAVIIIMAPCRMIQIYHPFFFCHEVSSSIFMVERELVDSSNTFISFNQTFYPGRWNFLELINCVADVQQHVPCSLLMDEWDSVVFLSSKRELIHCGNLKCIALSCNRNRAFQTPYTITEVHQAIQRRGWLTPLVIGRQL